MPLKKRRIELHTITDQMLFIGGASRDASSSPDAAREGGAGPEARIGVLRDAARSLSRAMKAIRALELSGPAAAPDVGRGVDFYDEVRRFEILLIERALLHTGGSQVRAASLLGLKTTTLNSKIKGYRINREEPA
jgi:DNA-binding NtrC family response regulator